MEDNTLIRQAYNAVMANINNKEEDTVAMVKIPVNLLDIDEEYQTVARTGRNLDNLVSNWDERKLAPILVSPHKDEGKFYVVDGFGRWQASQKVDAILEQNNKERKYEYLTAIVLLKLPDDKDKRRKIEAELFATQEEQKSKLKDIQMHGALRILGDKTVLLMDYFAEKYHFSLDKEEGKRENKPFLSSYSETKNMIKSNGKDCFEFVFDICKQSGFDRKPQGYQIFVLRGLRDLYNNIPDKREEVKNIVIDYWRKRTPSSFKKEATSKYPEPDDRTACCLYIEDYVCDKLHIDTFREVIGSKAYYKK